MKSIPVYKYIKKTKGNKARIWGTIEEAMENLDVQSLVAGQIIPGSSAYTFAQDDDELVNFSMIAEKCEYIGREGIEFYPQELLLFEYDSEGPRQGTVFLKNVQVQKSKYKIPSQKVLLETEYLYPLIKGPCIEYFNYSGEELIVPFPYIKGQYKKPVDRQELHRTSPLLLDYYEKYMEIIKLQTEYSNRIRGPDSGEYYGLARVGPYSFQDVYVAFRDNTKWRAAVFKNRVMPWGEEKRVVFQNHAVSICEKTDESEYITEDEAYYICAILNSKIVEKYIYASSDSRSFIIRPPVLIPKYEEENELHIKLSKLSREAHENIQDLDYYRNKIDDVYLSLVKKK